MHPLLSWSLQLSPCTDSIISKNGLKFIYISCLFTDRMSIFRAPHLVVSFLAFSVILILRCEGVEIDQELEGVPGATKSSYGSAIAADADNLYVGSRLFSTGSNRGLVDVYTHDGSDWQKSTSLPYPTSSYSYVSSFGENIFLSAEHVAVQFLVGYNSGTVVAIYERGNPSNYGIVGPYNGDGEFAEEGLFLDETTCLLSSPNENGGTLRVFKKGPEGWGLVETVAYADVSENTSPNLYQLGLGASLAKNDHFIAAGRPASDEVFIFEWDNDQLLLRDRIHHYTSDGKGYFGSALAFDGDELLVSAFEDNGGATGTKGAIFHYQSINGDWTLKRRITNDWIFELGRKLTIKDDLLAATGYQEVALFKKDSGGDWQMHGVVHSPYANESLDGYYGESVQWDPIEPGRLLVDQIRSPDKTDGVVLIYDLSSFLEAEAAIPTVDLRLNNDTLETHIDWAATPGATSTHLFRGLGYYRSNADDLSEQQGSTFLDTSNKLTTNKQFYYWVVPSFELGELFCEPAIASINVGNEGYLIEESLRLNSNSGFNYRQNINAKGDRIIISSALFEKLADETWAEKQRFGGGISTIADFSDDDEWLVTYYDRNWTVLRKGDAGMYQFHQQLSDAKRGVFANQSLIIQNQAGELEIYRLDDEHVWVSAQNIPFPDAGTNASNTYIIKMFQIDGELVTAVNFDPGQNDEDISVVYFLNEDQSTGIWELTDSFYSELNISSFDYDGTRMVISTRSPTEQRLSVFRRDNELAWIEEARILPSELYNFETTDTSINNNLLIVNASGNGTYIFNCDKSNQWLQQAYIPHSFDKIADVGFLGEHIVVTGNYESDKYLSFIKLLDRDPLKAITGLYSEYGASQSEAVLSWDTPDQQDLNYQTLITYSPELHLGSLLEPTTESNLTTSLRNGVTHYFRVRPTNASGTQYGPWSDPIPFTANAGETPVTVESIAPFDATLDDESNSEMIASIFENDERATAAVTRFKRTGLQGVVSILVVLYEKSAGGEWRKLQELDITAPADRDVEYVSDIVMGEDEIFIGFITDKVWVYNRQPDGSWAYEREILPPTDGPTLSGFGRSLAWSAPYLFVSAPNDSPDDGEIVIFEQQPNGDFNLHQIIDPELSYPLDSLGGQIYVKDDFLFALRSLSFDSVNGSILTYEKGLDNQWTLKNALNSNSFWNSFVYDDGQLLTSTPVSSSASGYVEVMELDVGGNWTVVQTIRPPAGYEQSKFGSSLAIHENLLLVGSPSDSNLGSLAGMVFVYVRDENREWQFTGRIEPNGSEGMEYFGYELHLSGRHGLLLAEEKRTPGSYPTDRISFLQVADWFLGPDDANLNLIDDAWELTYYPASDMDPDGDDDGDGISNRVEGLLRTNPHQSNMLFNQHIEFDTLRGLSIDIGNAPSSGILYLESAYDLDGSWRKIRSWRFSGGNTDISFEDSVWQPQKFYRFVFEPLTSPVFE